MLLMLLHAEAGRSWTAMQFDVDALLRLCLVAHGCALGAMELWEMYAGLP